MIIQASIKALPNSFINREENYKLVDEALKLIYASGLKSIIGPSETTVEGMQKDIIRLIEDIQNYYYENDINFSMFVTFEYNKDKFYIEAKKENIKKIVN